MFVLCLAVLAGLAAVVVVKSCPPTPAPAGKPVPDDMPVVVSTAEAKLPTPTEQFPAPKPAIYTPAAVR